MKKDLTKLDFGTIIRTLYAEEIITLYREAYECGYATEDVYSMEELDDVFCGESPLDLLETYEINRNVFCSDDEYFISRGGVWGELISYNSEDLAQEILREYIDVLEEFYNEDREKFLSVLDK